MVGEQERIEIGKEEEKGLVRLLLFALGRAGCSLGWVGILGGGGGFVQERYRVWREQRCYSKRHSALWLSSRGTLTS